VPFNERDSLLGPALPGQLRHGARRGEDNGLLIKRVLFNERDGLRGLVVTDQTRHDIGRGEDDDLLLGRKLFNERNWRPARPRRYKSALASPHPQRGWRPAGRARVL